MSEFILAPAARFDLFEIWNYYAAEVCDAALADRMRDEIFDGIRAVAKAPGIGHLRTDLAQEPLRFWRVRDYLVIYRVGEPPIGVARVLHGARDVKAILGSAS